MSEEEIKSLEMIFADLFAFIDELMKDYDEPISPTLKEIEQLKKQIIENPSNHDPHFPKQFYLIERVAGEILFSHNLDKFLGISSNFDLMQFHSHINDGSGNWDYLKEYLTWGKAAYMFFAHYGKIYDLIQFSFKVMLPMILVDGRVYWITQETRPLEFDKERNMISHINTYTISGLYKEKSPINLSIEIHYNDLYRADWTEILAENRYAIRPFSLSHVQKDILLFYFQNQNTNTVICSSALKYPRNTIKKYISNSQRGTGILDRAKLSFPHINIRSMSDLVKFLDSIGWFNKNL